MSKIDKIIHEQTRLMIITYIATAPDIFTSFNEIKNKLNLTSGNLSVQLKKLEENGYVSIIKEFKDNKPHTKISISDIGRLALEKYIESMEEIISNIKKK